MNETSRLTLAVDSRQVRTASTDLDRFASAGKKTETATQGVARQFVSLRGALGGISAALAVRAIIQSADAYNNLNARLRLVTKSATEFAAAQKGVFDIAQGTRTGLTETADLFGSLSRATEELGVSQENVLGVTQTINQALQVSGASAAGASAALIQLGQGFAAGALRGEELNSVLEQAPRLARAIADGLGVPIGKLRELGAAGELTAEKVFKALQGSAAQLQREFDGLPLTVGAATTQASNSLLKLIGVLDETTGASSSVASALSSAAGFVGQLADEIDRLNNGGLADVNSGFGFLAASIQTVSVTVRVLAANVSFVLGSVGREFAAVFAQIKLVAEVLAAPPGDLIATARRNWAGFNAISEAVKEDGIRARRELDGLERTLLGLNNARAIGSENDARRGRGFNAGAGSIAQTQAIAAQQPKPRAQPRETVSEAERYLESLQKQLQATQDLSVAETVLADIKAGRLGKVAAADQAALLAVAQQIDAANHLESQLKAEQAQIEDFAAARKTLADEGRRIFEETRTPAERLAAEIDRLNRLLQEGAVDWDTYARATFNAQDAYDAAIEGSKKVVEETNNLAKDLGLTFSSAFENAIVAGGNLRDVLKGLEQDILRLVTRQLVTQPLANAIGGFDFSSLIPNLFGGGRATGGPVQRGRMYEINEGGAGEILNVGNRQYLMAAQNGSVQRGGGVGGMSVVNNFTVSGNVNRETQQQIASAVARSVESASRRNN